MPLGQRVVLIGGGHNALVAAAYLARAGCSVLVLERLAQLGGAAVNARPFQGVDVTVPPPPEGTEPRLEFAERRLVQAIDPPLGSRPAGDESVVPEHLEEVRGRKLELIVKTEAAVKERLTKEISYWDHRAEELKLQEQAGKPNARLNSDEARKRADNLQGRLEKRMEELKLEAQISPLPE